MRHTVSAVSRGWGYTQSPDLGLDTFVVKHGGNCCVKASCQPQRRQSRGTVNIVMDQNFETEIMGNLRRNFQTKDDLKQRA